MTQEEHNKLDLILEELKTHNKRGTDIYKIVQDLPCKNKDEGKNPLFKINGLSTQVKVQWWFIGALVLVIIIRSL